MGCAAVVLAFLCAETSHGGALKKNFTKDNKDEHLKIEESVSSDKKEDAQSVSDELTKPQEEAKQSNDSDEKAKADSQTTSTEKKKIIGDPIVLRINGKKEFRRSQILEDMKLIPPQMVQGIAPDKLFEMLVTQRLNTYLMIEQARKAGMDRTKDFLDKVERYKEELLGRSFLIKELTPKAENESALKARYTKYLVEFKKGKECKIFHIMVSSEKVAKEILAALGNGEDFSKIAKEKSEASSKADGGEEKGYIPLEALPSPIKEKIAALKKDEYTKEFVKTDKGECHIFKVTDIRDTSPQKFDDIKDTLKQVIMHEEMVKLVERLEKQVKVDRFNEDGSPFVSRKGVDSAK
jgi:peptidyl-prolyl cis-trans isomerase C